ncbi:MAG: SPOR domain-containing protein [Saprospiraceae bacterium]|nr:SPOR domain-containing protein [Saprospiraceae bacterium]
MAIYNNSIKLIWISLILCGPILKGQTNIIIKEDPTVSREMEKYIRNNSSVTHLSGWRIAVTTTTDRRLMEQTKVKFQNQFDYKVKWEYKEPYYYLRAGAFLTRTEANQALDAVKKKFPEAFLSMDKVAYEEL